MVTGYQFGTQVSITAEIAAVPSAKITSILPVFASWLRESSDHAVEDARARRMAAVLELVFFGHYVIAGRWYRERAPGTGGRDERILEPPIGRVIR